MRPAATLPASGYTDGRRAQAYLPGVFHCRAPGMTSESWDMTRFSNWIIGLVVVLIFASAWYLLNRPANEQPWEGDVGGLTYTPYRTSTDVKNRVEPSRDRRVRDDHGHRSCRHGLHGPDGHDHDPCGPDLGHRGRRDPAR